MSREQLIYRSENGDHWVLVHESGADKPFVRHTANPSSGGQITDIAVDEFLSRGRGAPEYVALRRLLSRARTGGLTCCPEQGSGTYHIRYGQTHKFALGPRTSCGVTRGAQKGRPRAEW